MSDKEVKHGNCRDQLSPWLREALHSLATRIPRIRLQRIDQVYPWLNASLAERAKKTCHLEQPDCDAGTSKQLGEDGHLNDSGTNENGTQTHKKGGKEQERRMIYDDDPSMFNPGENLRVGIIQASPDGSTAYECCYCIERYGDIETLKVHVHSYHHPELLTKQILVGLGLGSKVKYGVQLSNVTATTHLSKPFVCIHCTGTFKLKNSIYLHFKEKHTPHKPYACMDCHETFRTQIELRRHSVYYCPLSKKIKKPKRKRQQDKDEEREDEDIYDSHLHSSLKGHETVPRQSVLFKSQAEQAKKTCRIEQSDCDAGTSKQLVEDGHLNDSGTNENGNQIHKKGGKEQERRMIYDDDPSMFNPGENLRVGIIQVSPDGSTTYECCYCIERYGDIETLKVHVRSFHRPELLTKQILVGLGLGSKVKYGVQLSNVTATTHLSKPFVCIHCTGTFKLKNNIYLHFKEKHTPHKPFACMDCHETFRTQMELRRHSVYYCPLSKKRKIQQVIDVEREDEDMYESHLHSSLKGHEMVPHQSELFKSQAGRAKTTCHLDQPDCDAGTRKQLVEDGHLNYSGTNENGNQIHKKGEEEQERRMIYDDDPSMFNPGEKLRVGIIQASPDGSTAYECCYCIERYGDIETLKVHVRSYHRPELLTKQIPVELGFGSKVNCGAQLSNVTATSDLSKPFVCIHCTGTFKFKCNINLHYNEKHTPHKPFACMDCDETFRTQMELRRHSVYYCPLGKVIKNPNVVIGNVSLRAGAVLQN